MLNSKESTGCSRCGGKGVIYIEDPYRDGLSKAIKCPVCTDEQEDHHVQVPVSQPDCEQCICNMALKFLGPKQTVFNQMWQDTDGWECAYCGEAWCLEEGPAKHNYNFCPGCGREIKYYVMPMD